MLFINTRPSSRALLLTQSLQQAAIKVCELPLLKLTPIDISPIENLYQQKLNDGEYAAMVCVSPSAASLGLQSCQLNFGKLFRPSCPVIAVGDATAAVFNKAKWQTLRPNVPNAYDPKNKYEAQSKVDTIDDSIDECIHKSSQIKQVKIGSNESMMRMPELASLKAGEKVLIWRGEGGRRLLVNHLQEKSVIVDAIAWYKRQQPEDLDVRFATLYPMIANDEPIIVLISSAQAFDNWQQLLQRHNDTAINANAKQDATFSPLTLAQFRYLVLGERLASLLSNYSVTSQSTNLKSFKSMSDQPLLWQQIENLDPDTIKRAIVKMA